MRPASILDIVDAGGPPSPLALGSPIRRPLVGSPTIRPYLFSLFVVIETALVIPVLSYTRSNCQYFLDISFNSFYDDDFLVNNEFMQLGYVLRLLRQGNGW